MDFFRSLIKISAIKRLQFQPWMHQILSLEAEDLAAYEASTLNMVGGGIYRMYNEAGEVIYVGKSNDIHRRLMQHVGHRSNTAYFVDEVKKVDFHVNENPIMQTLLESIFIAYHTPKYNDEVQDAAEMNPEGEFNQ